MVNYGVHAMRALVERNRSILTFEPEELSSLYSAIKRAYNTGLILGEAATWLRREVADALDRRAAYRFRVTKVYARLAIELLKDTAEELHSRQYRSDTVEETISRIRKHMLRYAT